MKLSIGIRELASPLGRLWLAGSENGLALLDFRKNKRDFLIRCKNRFPDARIEDGNDITIRAAEWIEAYFKGARPSLDRLSFDLSGTDFQCAVWRVLQDIPFGEVMTYGEVARAAGIGSARAVGQAVGKNPVPLLIPCHRVVAANGGLGGFSSGLEIKIALLRQEGLRVDPARGRYARESD